ncbi:hypothetical protein CNECB9_200005 [Cupriavidus necator]|uniref:Uncharacterized protein n=1 Tax=Cupriavidus necator TaxID=106590 RepID=A0A1K0JA09_CUPNE|nr:hypothetical protein CNECB9_200005 [Cupriavidus necator]
MLLNSPAIPQPTVPGIRLPQHGDDIEAFQLTDGDYAL